MVGKAVLGRGQEGCLEALTKARERMPFPWCEVHPDNDSSFINWHLVRYCEEEGITLSRSRPYKKNDNCFVEEKNKTHVRAVLGHLRYDSDREQAVINGLYRYELRLYKNFFQPVMKLTRKIREKGKVHRRYDTPRTPYQRLMESEQIPDETKNELAKVYQLLNPAELKRNIDQRLQELFHIYQEKEGTVTASRSKRHTPQVRTQSYLLNGRTTPASVT